MYIIAIDLAVSQANEMFDRLVFMWSVMKKKIL